MNLITKIFYIPSYIMPALFLNYVNITDQSLLAVQSYHCGALLQLNDLNLAKIFLDSY